MKQVSLFVFSFLFSCTFEPSGTGGSGTAEEYLAEMMAIMTSGKTYMEFSSKTDLTKVLPPEASTTGISPSMAMKGRMTSGRRLGARQETFGEFTLESNMPPVGEVVTEMKMVSDLETLWLDQSVAAAGQRQVMKFSWNSMEAMDNKMTGMSMQSMNPADQIRALSEFMTFDIGASDPSEVVLSATVAAAEFSEAMGQPLPAGLETMTVDIYLDKATNLPSRMVTSSSRGPFMEMNFHKIESLESINSEIFSYQPPEGIPVIDMDKVLSEGLNPQ